MNDASACSRHAAGRRPTAGDDDRGGYTLLELLIVGVLLSVLMLGVWSLFRNWSGLYERGETQTRRLQLARSLCDQFAEDLQAVTSGATIPAAHSGNSSTSTSASSSTGADAGSLAEPYALIGGADWIVLNIVQAANPWQGAAAAEDSPDTRSTQPEPSDRVALAAPELRRVVYAFTAPEPEVPDSLSSRVAELAAQDDTELVGEESEEEEAPTTGLSRTVVALEAAMSMSGADLRALPRAGSREDSAAPAGGSAMVPRSSGSVRFGEGRVAALEPDESTEDTDRSRGILERDDVPEVETFSLRYFDGTAWQGSWNSQSQGRLPVAVELRFTLKVDPVERPLTASRTDGTSSDTKPTGARDTAPVRSGSGAGRLSRSKAAGADDDEESSGQRWIVVLGPAPPPTAARVGEVGRAIEETAL